MQVSRSRVLLWMNVPSVCAGTRSPSARSPAPAPGPAVRSCSAVCWASAGLLSGSSHSSPALSPHAALLQSDLGVGGVGLLVSGWCTGVNRSLSEFFFFFLNSTRLCVPSRQVGVCLHTLQANLLLLHAHVLCLQFEPLLAVCFQLLGQSDEGPLPFHPQLLVALDLCCQLLRLGH